MTLPELRLANLRLLALAEGFMRDGKPDLAVRMWRGYLKAVPHDPEVIFNIGTTLQEISTSPIERHEAAQCFEAVVKSTDASAKLKADALNNLGLIALTAGQPEQAKIAYEMALNLCSPILPKHHVFPIR